MLTDLKHHFDGSREDRLFDTVVMALAVLIIVGGLAIVYSSSGEYRVANVPPIAAPVIAPWAVPDLAPVTK